MKYTAMMPALKWCGNSYGNFVGDMSSLSGSEVESENEDDAGTSETGTSSNDQTKNESSSKTGLNKSRKASERRGRAIESDISDTEYNEEMSKERKLQVVAAATVMQTGSKYCREREGKGES